MVWSLVSLVILGVTLVSFIFPLPSPPLPSPSYRSTPHNAVWYARAVRLPHIGPWDSCYRTGMAQYFVPSCLLVPLYADPSP